MLIGIDIDGVLRDFETSVRKTYLTFYPEHACLIKPPTEWNMARFYPIGDGLWDFVWQQYPRQVFFENAEPYPKAIEFVRELSAIEDVSIVLITNQPTSGARYATWQWLSRYGLLDIAEDIVMLGGDGLVRGTIGLDVLLDDHLENLQACVEPTSAVCFDQPWNQEWPWLRVHSYDEFLNLVRELLDGVGCCLERRYGHRRKD